MKGTYFSVLISSLLFITFSCSAQKELTNEMIWSPESRMFSAESVRSVRSMNDGLHFSLLGRNAILKYSYENFGTPIDTILNLNRLSLGGEKLFAQDYFFNADESQVLIATKIQYIYRRSFTSNYYIVDLATKKIQKLAENGPQQLADFSPDGSKVAYVFENNIYYKDLNTGNTVQVTYDGKRNEIINGGTDWVYEEEFSITKGFYWSPDSKKIGFYQFDETDVPEFTMPYYFGKTYPFQYTFKYPKAGEDNSKLSVLIYELDNAKSFQYISSGPSYEYFPRMKWTKTNELCVLGMNRHQNKLTYFIVDDYHSQNNRSTRVIYVDESDTYVEVDDNLIFLNDGESFLRTSEKDGYNHIYKVNFKGKVKQITDGKWDVIELKGINEETGKIYYTSAEEGAIYKALYAINLKGKDKVKLSKNKGSNDAEFSTGMKYYINHYSNANRPELITLHNAEGKELETLKSNEQLIARLKKLKLSTKEFITIKGVDTELNASIIKPRKFNKKNKYPVYFYIYNGPGNNVVADEWQGKNYIYHQLLAQRGYIVISVDTRGTMYRGADFKKSTYLQLGKLETEDMIAVAKKVAKWDYVDGDRIGVQGWSYGGYMAALCMTKGADVFKMGISVAPVTNWRWYDNIYTERFMRTPQENASGYDDNSPINHVDKLKGNYLIVHGSGDDNVHIQNSMEMIEEMVEKNKLFDMAVYPNKNHGIYGGKTRLHLYNKLLNFTVSNL